MNALPEEIFNAVENDCSMVDGIDVYAGEAVRELSCHSSREVVNVQLYFHISRVNLVDVLAVGGREV